MTLCETEGATKLDEKNVVIAVNRWSRIAIEDVTVVYKGSLTLVAGDETENENGLVP